MSLYILKSSAILIIFWLIYILLIERQHIHQFKRFYLLTAILAALIIPLLSITEYIYVTPVEDTFELTSHTLPAIQEIVVEETSSITLNTILWVVYVLGVSVFGIRFLKNLGSLLYTIKQNEKVKQWSFTYVLLKKAINPHTFFNYIFFNKNTFKNKTLPREVILHEETHAKQKHSIDVLFIELIQIAMWFNPLVYLYKKSIKLNHEFLADAAVLNNGVNASNYQNTLLTYSSQGTDYQLANAINYSSIKKRFTVMKTTTSKTRAWLTSLLVLPLLAILFYSFSSREVVEIEEEPELIVEEVPLGTSYTDSEIDLLDEFIIEESKAKNDYFLIYVNHRGLYLIDRVAYTLKSIEKMVSELEKKELTLRVKYSSPIEKVKAVVDLLNSIDGLKVNPTIYHNISQKVSAEKEKEIKALLNTVGKLNVVTIDIPAPTKLIIEREPVEKTNWDDIKFKLSSDGKILNQEKATAKQVAEYNAWAKKINEGLKAPKDSPKRLNTLIKSKDFKKYNHIYSIMTAEQKKNAESFPNIPPPPPPARPKIIEVKENKKTKSSSNLPPPPPPAKKKSSKNAPIIVEEVEAPKKKNGDNLSKIVVDAYKKQSNNTPEIVEVELQEGPKYGPIEINGKDYFYSQTNNKTTLYSKYGSVVDIKSLLSSPEAIKKAIKQHEKNVEKATQIYGKANPKSVSKVKIGDNNKEIEVVEVPTSLSGYVEINGEQFYYLKEDGKKTYYNKFGKEVDITKFKKASGNKTSKGGPNANDIELVFTDKMPEKPSVPDSKDYMTRYVILKASKNQTQPLVYKLNGKLSNITSIENYLKNNHEAYVSFKQGDKNILHFFDNNGSKMTNTALQNVYTELYKTYKKTGNTLILSEKEVSPNKQKIKSNNNKQQAYINHTKNIDKEQVVKSIKALNDYAATNTYEKMMGADSEEKRIMRKHLEIINEYAATNSL